MRIVNNFTRESLYDPDTIGDSCLEFVRLLDKCLE